MRKLNAAVDRFAYNHPRFGIPNLMKFIVLGNTIVYMLSVFAGYSAVSFLAFNWEAIKAGELWRLVTFIFMPGYYSLRDAIWLLLFLYFYYMIGTTLEREWGTPKFNLYYFSGVVLTVLVGILSALISGQNVWISGTSYVNLSMFFAFAMLYPETRFLLFYIIPVKVKWLALIDAVFFALSVLSSLVRLDLAGALLPIIALLNYFLFFGDDLLGLFRRKGQQVRYRTSAQTINFKKAQKEVQQRKGYLHKCAVCGITDADDPNMEFRYCSKCNGYYCYCSKHINNHTHVQ